MGETQQLQVQKGEHSSMSFGWLAVEFCEISTLFNLFSFAASTHGTMLSNKR